MQRRRDKNFATLRESHGKGITSGVTKILEFDWNLQA
jgi:hypothetical protein